jgi:hypothetical protein
MPLEIVADVVESAVVQLVERPQGDVEVLVVVQQGAAELAREGRISMMMTLSDTLEARPC